MNDIELERLQHSHTFGQEQRKAGEKRTLWVIAITVTMMVVEIAAGLAFGSMALLADGLHMASHSVALGIAAFAYIYARRHAADPRFSFGTGKVNALAGFTGALLLFGFAGVMAWESVARLLDPTPIVFNWAIAVAVVGLVVNGASMLILGDRQSHSHDHSHSHHSHSHASKKEPHPHHPHSEGHSHDQNLRSAYLHVMADALTSVTAIIALLSAKYFNLLWMDPTMGIVGSLLVANWSIGLARSSSRTLLDHQASAADLAEIRAAVEVDRTRVTDLHLWSIGPGINSAMISLVTSDPRPPQRYKDRLPRRLGIVHVTVEIHTDRSQ